MDEGGGNLRPARKVEGANGGGSGADTLLSELTTLKLKLEKVMEHDFKAQEQAKLRKEVLLNRLSVSFY